MFSQHKIASQWEPVLLGAEFRGLFLIAMCMWVSCNIGTSEKASVSRLDVCLWLCVYILVPVCMLMPLVAVCVCECTIYRRVPRRARMKYFFFWKKERNRSWSGKVEQEKRIKNGKRKKHSNGSVRKRTARKANNSKVGTFVSIMDSSRAMWSWMFFSAMITSCFNGRGFRIDGVPRTPLCRRILGVCVSRSTSAGSEP